MEALLGAIIQSADTRARGIITDLKTDSLAREIIERVDRGPYGSASKDDASPAEQKATRESQDARTSRIKREIFSSSLGECAIYNAASFTTLTALVDGSPQPSADWLRRLEDILVVNNRTLEQMGSPIAKEYAHLR